VEVPPAFWEPLPERPAPAPAPVFINCCHLISICIIWVGRRDLHQRQQTG
jgi:hypothetical protein